MDRSGFHGRTTARSSRRSPDGTRAGLRRAAVRSACDATSRRRATSRAALQSPGAAAGRDAACTATARPSTLRRDRRPPGRARRRRIRSQCRPAGRAARACNRAARRAATPARRRAAPASAPTPGARARGPPPWRSRGSTRAAARGRAPARTGSARAAGRRGGVVQLRRRRGRGLHAAPRTRDFPPPRPRVRRLRSCARAAVRRR